MDTNGILSTDDTDRKSGRQEKVLSTDSILYLDQERNNTAMAQGFDDKEKRKAWLDGIKARGDHNLEARLAEHGRKK